MVASIASIMLNMIILNGFGAELDLKTVELIILRFKIAPAIFISMIFRCSSFVMMTTLLRFYSAFPILLIMLMYHYIRRTRNKLYENKALRFLDLCKSPYTKTSKTISKNKKRKNNQRKQPLYYIVRLLDHSAQVLTGSVLVEIQRYAWYIIDRNFTEQEKKNHDKDRRTLYFFDSMISLVTHGLCMVILIILWEKTSVLDDNLGLCAFSWTKVNISVLCGVVIALGTINCLFSFIYYYSIN